jgi:predicted double-glycine peptidase
MLKTRAFQQRPGACGPASLKILLHFFGITKTEKQIIQMSGATPEKGIEAEDLIKVIKKFKLKVAIKDRAEIKDIRKYVKEKKIPVIVEWFLVDDGHFSVVTDIDRENIYLQDPDLGHIRAMTISTFMRLWFSFPGKYMRGEYDIRLRRMIVAEK